MSAECLQTVLKRNGLFSSNLQAVLLPTGVEPSLLSALASVCQQVALFSPLLQLELRSQVLVARPRAQTILSMSTGALNVSFTMILNVWGPFAGESSPSDYWVQSVAEGLFQKRTRWFFCLVLLVLCCWNKCFCFRCVDFPDY